MSWVIDIQGLFDEDKKFTPKEVAMLCLQNNTMAHWLVKPPHDFTKLSDDIKVTNNYCTTSVHSIEWYHGDISVKQLHYHLYNFAKYAKQIYVRGADKAKYLEAVVCRRVINLEDYRGPAFKKLEKNFPKVDTVCLHHIRDLAEKRLSACALYKVHLLKQWFYSILDDDWLAEGSFDLTPSYYHCALLNYQTSVKTSYTNVENNADEQHDVVDVANKYVFRDVHDSIITDDEQPGPSTPLRSSSRYSTDSWGCCTNQ